MRKQLCIISLWRQVWAAAWNALFLRNFMKKSRKLYNLYHKCAAILMIMALVWLTVSMPFVLAFQQELAHEKMAQQQNTAGNNEDNNPFNNIEEKVPGNNSSFSEEYLHDLHVIHHVISEAAQYHKCENARTYIAFHGELLVPPPNNL
jgi:hypothetical protein